MIFSEHHSPAKPQSGHSARHKAPLPKPILGFARDVKSLLIPTVPVGISVSARSISQSRQRQRQRQQFHSHFPPYPLGRELIADETAHHIFP